MAILLLLCSACSDSDSASDNNTERQRASTTTAPDDVNPDDTTKTGDTEQPPGDSASVEPPGEPDEPEPPELPVFAEPEPDDTPIALDSDVRTATLDNGLTYYAQSNDNPGRSVSIRLVVRAGGSHEQPLGTGVAHLMEHMVFNGTEKFPTSGFVDRADIRQGP